MDWGSLLFSFHGRINRAKYWLAILIYIIAGIVAGIIGYVTGSATVMLILNAVVGIGGFISGLAVAIKRLHDRDKAGWWLLVFYILPMVLYAVGFGLGMGAGSGSIVMIFSLAAFAIFIWAFVELGCLRGTVGPNQYGPDPLGGMMMSAGPPGAPPR